MYHIDELIAHPQLVARGFLMAVERPGVGALRLPGLPMQLSKTPWRVRLPAPLLGEHNVQVYCDELGYERSDVTIWRQQGVV